MFEWFDSWFLEKCTEIDQNKPPINLGRDAAAAPALSRKENRVGEAWWGERSKEVWAFKQQRRSWGGCRLWAAALSVCVKGQQIHESYCVWGFLLSGSINVLRIVKQSWRRQSKQEWHTNTTLEIALIWKFYSSTPQIKTPGWFNTRPPSINLTGNLQLRSK